MEVFALFKYFLFFVIFFKILLRYFTSIPDHLCSIFITLLRKDIISFAEEQEFGWKMGRSKSAVTFDRLERGAEGR